MIFEWDFTKEQGNIAKHGVDFQTATKVFLDPLMLEFEDTDSTGERRWNAIGMVDNRLLFMTYCERGEQYRIISARGAEPYEKRKYHNTL